MSTATSFTTRLATIDDAVPLAQIVRSGREALAPFEPERQEQFFTEAGQRFVLENALREHELGLTVPHVILVDGVIVGRITLSGIVHGAFDSANLGYWVSPAFHGRGVGTAAVGEIIQVAFEDHGLHRIQAGTLLHNVGSQKVLERNGFVRFGLAQRYLRIAGTWQDHVLYQLIAPRG